MKFEVIVKKSRESEEIHIQSVSLDKPQSASTGVRVAAISAAFMLVPVSSAWIYGASTGDYSLLKQIAGAGAYLVAAVAKAAAFLLK